MSREPERLFVFPLFMRWWWAVAGAGDISARVLETFGFRRPSHVKQGHGACRQSREENVAGNSVTNGLFMDDLHSLDAGARGEFAASACFAACFLEASPGGPRPGRALSAKRHSMTCQKLPAGWQRLQLGPIAACRGLMW